MAPSVLLALLLQAPAPAPAETGAVRELSFPADPQARVEYFRLDERPWRGEPAPPDLAPPEGEDPAAVEEPAPLAVVRLLAAGLAPPAASSSPGVLLEREVVFLGEATRVLQTERVYAGEGLLVWRELRPRAGRTVLAQWDDEGGLRSAQTMGSEVLRRSHERPRGGFALPLGLVEEGRRDARLAGPFRVFDPLSGDLEEVRARTRPSAPGEPGERVLELRRPDGLSAGRYAFRGEELVAFQWQAGGPVARRIPREGFDGWHGEAEALPVGPDVDAILEEALAGDRPVD